MINSISTVGMAIPTSSQQQLISDTLSKYDVNNLTNSDAQAIVSTFQKAGIEPGKDLTTAMDQAGFDAKQIGNVAGGHQGPPPRGPRPSDSQGQSQGTTLSENVLQDLYTLLDKYYANDTTNADRTSLTNSISSLLGSNSSIFSAKV